MDVSNNNRLVFFSTIIRKVNFTTFRNNDGLILLDMNQNQVMTTIPSNILFRQIRISDDGNFISQEDGKLPGSASEHLYRVLPDTLTLIGTRITGQFLFGRNPTECIEIGNGAIHIRDCNTLALQAMYPTESTLGGPVLDPVTGYLGGVIGNTFRVYDLNTGQLLKTIKIAPGGYILANSHLISSNGWHIPVELP